jgi:hypothetical protein
LIRTYYGPLGKSKSDVEKDCKQEEHLESHRSRCIKFEAMKRPLEDGEEETPSKRRRVRDPVSALGEVEVHVEKSSSMNMEEECGNFWPMDVWRKHHTGAPEPSVNDQYELINKLGKPVRGLIREPSDGTAIGVVRLTSTSSVRAIRDTTIARRSEAVEASHIDDVFAAASARIGGHTKMKNILILRFSYTPVMHIPQILGF